MERFDRLVFACIAGLIVAIAGVSLLGNNIGVQVQSHSPQTTGRSDSTLRIRFFQDMDKASVASHVEISPPTEGRLDWSGEREMIFRPDSALVAGQGYQVVVAAGAESADGTAELKDDYTFSFRVGYPRVLYLSPATSQQRNLHLYDLNTGEMKQLTNAPYGIADYAVSADGTTIAFTEYKEDGTSDIWLYNLRTGETAQITNCVNAYCGAPAWKPDGTQIAYERDEFDPIGGLTARRVWLVDTLTAQSALLFQDTQITGHSPRFSPTGNRLAMFSTNPPGILVWDFVAQNRSFIENMQGVVGDFSPDGSRLIYPILVRGAIGATFYTQLEMVDFNESQRTAVSGPTESPIDDMMGFWRPGHPSQLVVERRYLDDRYTDGPQLYLLDTDSDEVTPLVIDGDYNHGAVRWSADGNLLVLQRFNRRVQGSRPEIWVYNLGSDTLQQIATDAYLPNFVP